MYSLAGSLSPLLNESRERRSLNPLLSSVGLSYVFAVVLLRDLKLNRKYSVHIILIDKD